MGINYGFHSPEFSYEDETKKNEWWNALRQFKVSATTKVCYHAKFQTYSV